MVSSERYAIICLALVYNNTIKMIWSISMIVGLKFFLCSTYAFMKIQGMDF